MARNSPTDKVDETLGTGARVHEYRDSQLPPLSDAREHTLGVCVQKGNVALEQLNRQVADYLVSVVQDCDFSPLSADEVVGAIRESIRAQLVKCAGAGSGLTGLVQAISDFVRDKICDQLEAIDPRGEHDFGAWIAERIPLTEIEQSLSTRLSATADSWSALEAREVAINELAQSHMPLAKPLAFAAMTQPFERDDLLHEAFLILRRAAESFDPGRGNRFSSYAKTALQRELKRKSPSRSGLKRQTAKQVSAFNSARKALSQRHGASASLDEIYELLGHNERTRIQIENVRRLLGGRRRSQREGELDMLDALDSADPKSLNPPQQAGDQEELVLVEAALERLSPLERAVVIGVCKFGKSFRGMAKEHRKSPSTLSSVFTEALDKLAHRIDSKWVSPKPR